MGRPGRWWSSSLEEGGEGEAGPERSPSGTAPARKALLLSPPKLENLERGQKRSAGVRKTKTEGELEVEGKQNV